MWMEIPHVRKISFHGEWPIRCNRQIAGKQQIVPNWPHTQDNVGGNRVRHGRADITTAADVDNDNNNDDDDDDTVNREEQQRKTAENRTEVDRHCLPAARDSVRGKLWPSSRVPSAGRHWEFSAGGRSLKKSWTIGCNSSRGCSEQKCPQVWVDPRVGSSRKF